MSFWLLVLASQEAFLGGGSMAWNDPWFLDLGPSHGAWLESQEHDPSQNAWSRCEEGKHVIATGQELTPGQNAWSLGEEGKHAMAPGQELTPGQNASLDVRCERQTMAMASSMELQ